MHLCFVRHAESLGNAAGVLDNNSDFVHDSNGLSEQGRLQAENLACLLASHSFDVVIISPLRRTRETMAPYLAKHTVPVVVLDFISEHCVGVFAGQRTSALKEYCALEGITDRVSFTPEGGESILDVYGRAKKFKTYLQNNFAGKSVLVCGHATFLRCLFILLEKKSISDFYSTPAIVRGVLYDYEL